MDKDKGNSNKNNSDKDNFQRMLELADFGAKRMEERRSVEFKVFISYITLLVLALYQLLKQNPISLKSLIYDLIGQEPIPFISPFEGIALLGLALGMHIIYVMWQVGVSIAMENDAYRRNFYLKKAQCISGSPLNYEDEKDKIDRKIITIQRYLKQFSCLWIIWEHWARILLIAIPTFLFTIVVHLFYKKTNPELKWLSLIPLLIFLVLMGVSVYQSRRRRCPATVHNPVTP